MSSLYSAVMRQKIDDVRRIIEENPNSVNEVNNEENKRTPIFELYFLLVDLWVDWTKIF